MQQDLKVQTISSLKNGKLSTHLKITPPKLQNGSKRNPVAIICVLDISGSMDCQATQGQSKQSDGFSRLDLVKHSVNTIIHSLDENDLIGVVTFSDSARLDFPLENMNENGKKKALEMIKNMKTQGSTNLWDGIYQGLELSKNPKCQSKNTFVVVLSDGQPNVHPQGGQLKACQNYIAEHPLACNLSMFGYGYNLNTKLLTSITELGGGCYGFIPDCSMVGTIFVNFLAHSLASYNALMTIQIKNQKQGLFVGLNGKNTQRVLLGSVQYGSKRNCLIEFDQVKDGQEVAQIVIKYGKNLRNQHTVKLTATNSNELSLLSIQNLRYKYIKFLQKAIQQAGTGQIAIAKKSQVQLVQQMQQLNKELNNNEFLQSLIKDMHSSVDAQGQVGKALENIDWWKKWGKHYLPALRIAHNIEMCTNFKDPGLQSYASELFRQNEGRIDTVFIKLPPPTPTIKKFDKQGNVRQVQNMGNYYNRYGGCIHGQCTAELIDGEIKKVKELKRGDLVKTHLGYAQIKCMIVTIVEQQIQMVTLQNGLIITNYHPVLHNNVWTFPIDISKPNKLYVDKYYNFVLQANHSLLVNGVYCVTLGHGFNDNQVIQHEYLGTQKVIDDLKKNVIGWRNGLIIMRGDEMIRDPVSNKIVGINYKEEITV